MALLQIQIARIWVERCDTQNYKASDCHNGKLFSNTLAGIFNAAREIKIAAGHVVFLQSTR